MRNVRRIGAALVFVLVACGGAASEGPGPGAPTNPGTPESDTRDEPGGVVSSPPNEAPKSPPAGPFACGLPAPVSSEDACTKDADCAPAEPCHARACVAVAKARPRGPDTVCTMSIDCQSADVNPCACYEGRCALTPKGP
jgi:hypothetical protein